MHEDQPRKGLKQAANLDPYFVLETEVIVQKTLTVAEFPSLPKNVCSSHGALPTPAGWSAFKTHPRQVWVNASLETLSTF